MALLLLGPMRMAFKPVVQILPTRSQGQEVPDFRTNPDRQDSQVVIL